MSHATRQTLLCREVRESHRIVKLLEREPHRYAEIAAQRGSLTFRLERSPHGIINLKGNHTKPFDITKWKAIRPRVWGRTVLYSSISLYDPARVEPDPVPSNLVPVSKIDWDGPEWVTLRP